MVTASWEQWKQAKATAIEYLAVFISAGAFIFAVIALVIGTVAMWVAYDANENAKVAQIYIQNLQREVDQNVR